MTGKENEEYPQNYTCNEYREEMILLGLRRRLQIPGLSEDEIKKLLQEIKRLELKAGF